MPLKMGKLVPKFHPKTLLFKNYVSDTLPAPAEKVFREYKVPDEAKLMYGNDQIGDCTCAGAANLIILTTCHTGDVVIPDVEDVIALYTAVSGYDPTTGANDNGAAMTDVLNYLHTTGLSGHKILAWAQIDHTNLEHRKLAVDLFGATYVGVQLPFHASAQFNRGDSWEVVPYDSIEGGHAIIHPGYGSLGDDYVTWAKWDQKASSAWSKAYIDEEYVVVTEDWIDQATQETPGGLNLDALLADLKALSA